MAKKIIVLGDDEQVSPSGIGIEIDKMNALLDSHITGIIPNAHLYDMKSSLYDIAKTTFQPLMLKEHFRCVPDIIGYSNLLSAEQDAKIRAKSNSPFETAVARFLVKEGSHIVQQWAVGSYRIDMVAIYEDNKIAIECDGELYHSGEDKVRADMERQTILERLGWRFIRIRGSEYYRNPEATMKRVVSELSNYDVYPEDTMKETEPQNNDLHNRVIASAAKILAVWEEKNDK